MEVDYLGLYSPLKTRHEGGLQSLPSEVIFCFPVYCIVGEVLVVSHPLQTRLTHGKTAF